MKWLCFLGLHRMLWGEVTECAVTFAAAVPSLETYGQAGQQEGRCECCGLVKRRWVE